LTATYLLSPEMFSRHIPWPLYIPLFGVFYIAGFAIECLGRIFGLIQIHRLDKSHFLERLRIFYPSWEDKDDTLKKNWIKHQEEEVDVENTIQGNESVQLTRERLIVLKQMCAAGSLAVFIAGVFLTIKLLLLKFQVSPEVTFIASMVVVGIAVVLLLASLYWGYRWAKLALDTVEQKVLPYQRSNQENKKEG
ncbi:hypothetical protein ACFLVW_02925, partial [Chloroflexota bacterium]